MNSKYLYLAIDFLSFIFPFLFSFYPKAPFYKKWKHLAISTLITLTIFVIWDQWFTHMGVWGFNPTYVTGIYFFDLPIEEILFFICIPYACIFTYEALNYLIEKDYLFPYHKRVTIILIFVLVLVGILNINKLYTSVTFIVLGLVFLFLLLRVNAHYMGRFYFSFLVIFIPFFIVNGILTGAFIDGEVVWYNNHENLGIRLGTIPIEDVFYGALMLLINISIFEKLKAQEEV